MRIALLVFAISLMTKFTLVEVQAATLRIIEGEGAPDCLLEMGGPDKISVMAQQGGGFTAQVMVRFLGMLDVFPPTKELRLEVTTIPSRRPDVFIGGVSELDMIPTFTISPSLLQLMAPRGEFSYVLDGRLVVTMNAPSQEDVDAFSACVMGHSTN